jgi:hypothetical protein
VRTEQFSTSQYVASFQLEFEVVNELVKKRITAAEEYRRSAGEGFSVITVRLRLIVECKFRLVYNQ